MLFLLVFFLLLQVEDRSNTSLQQLIENNNVTSNKNKNNIKNRLLLIKIITTLKIGSFSYFFLNISITKRIILFITFIIVS